MRLKVKQLHVPVFEQLILFQLLVGQKSTTQHNLTTTTGNDYIKQIPPREAADKFCRSFILTNTKHLQVMFVCFFSVCKYILYTRRVNLLLQVQGVREGLRGLACRVGHFYHLGHGDPEEDEVEKHDGQCFANDAS